MYVKNILLNYRFCRR